MTTRTGLAHGGRRLAVVILSLLGVGALTVAVLFFATQRTSADSGSGRHYGPFASTSPDSSTCGPDWANDTFQRSFTINLSTPNTVLERFDHGSFVTVAGPSPNACMLMSGPAGNGNTVGAGVKGDFSGSFDIAVSGGTFNSSAHCTPTTCNTTAGFIATIYGSSATYNTGATFFVFDYYTQQNGAWHNASANRNGNNGDITGAAVPGGSHSHEHHGDGPDSFRD